MSLQSELVQKGEAPLTVHSGFSSGAGSTWSVSVPSSCLTSLVSQGSWEQVSCRPAPGPREAGGPIRGLLAQVRVPSASVTGFAFPRGLRGMCPEWPIWILGPDRDASLELFMLHKSPSGRLSPWDGSQAQVTQPTSGALKGRG